MTNKMHTVNLSTNQIMMLIYAGNGGRIELLNPGAARSLRYAVKTLWRKLETR